MATTVSNCSGSSTMRRFTGDTLFLCSVVTRWLRSRCSALGKTMRDSLNEFVSAWCIRRCGRRFSVNLTSNLVPL